MRLKLICEFNGRGAELWAEQHRMAIWLGSGIFFAILRLSPSLVLAWLRFSRTGKSVGKAVEYRDKQRKTLS